MRYNTEFGEFRLVPTNTEDIEIASELVSNQTLPNTSNFCLSNCKLRCLILVAYLAALWVVTKISVL